MIDREARSKMVAALRSYMDDETSAFQFDEQIEAIACETEDETVQTIRRELWFFYDDCKDHQIVASKEEWDLFNRLMLVLKSEGEFAVCRGAWKWGGLEAAALAVLVFYAITVYALGLGPGLVLASLPFGAASMLIASGRSKRLAAHRPGSDPRLAPFATLGDLLSLRRRVSVFRKQPLRKMTASRTIRSETLNRVYWVPARFLWCLCSSVVLLFQALPYRTTTVTVSVIKR